MDNREELQDLVGPRKRIDYHVHVKYNADYDENLEPIDMVYVDAQYDYPSDCYYGRLHEGDGYTDWGNSTTIPNHWELSQAEEYLTLLEKGMRVSERKFNNYLKSDSKSFEEYEGKVVDHKLREVRNKVKATNPDKLSERQKVVYTAVREEFRDFEEVGKTGDDKIYGKKIANTQTKAAKRHILQSRGSKNNESR